METALLSIDEYLRTCYDPDCDYINGRVEERHGGEFRIGPSGVRIPDLRAAKGSSPEEEVFTQPPFIRIEILSEQDRLSRIQERLGEYLEFVVPNIWLVDPVKKQAWTYSSVGLLLVHDGILRASEAGGVYH